MTLLEIVTNDLVVFINGIDAELAKKVQNRLTALACLDPPADGTFGPTS